jgi:hypothetical protein
VDLFQSSPLVGIDNTTQMSTDTDHRLANRDGFVSDILVDSLDPLARDRIDPYQLAVVLFRSLT